MPWLTLLLEETDRDKDGVPDHSDAFPDDPGETLETNGDGIGNNADPDDDNDGMPDEWELKSGLNPLQNDALEDLDGDGFNNLSEFQRGTNPGKSNTASPSAMPWLDLLFAE